MLNLLAFFLSINCLLNGWFLTGLFLLYIAMAKELK